MIMNRNAFTNPWSGPVTFMAIALSALAATARAGTDSVVTFNEIHYHPNEVGAPEWIELHNQMSMRVDLSGWRLSGGIDFHFPENTVIPSKGHLVVQGPGLPLPLSLGPFDGQSPLLGSSG